MLKLQWLGSSPLLSYHRILGAGGAWILKRMTFFCSTSHHSSWSLWNLLKRCLGKSLFCMPTKMLPWSTKGRVSQSFPNCQDLGCGLLCRCEERHLMVWPIIGPGNLCTLDRPLKLVPTTDYPLGQSLRRVCNENWELIFPYKILIPFCLPSLVTSVTTIFPNLSIFNFCFTWPPGGIGHSRSFPLSQNLFSLLAFESPYSSFFPLTLLLLLNLLCWPSLLFLTLHVLEIPSI